MLLGGIGYFIFISSSPATVVISEEVAVIKNKLGIKYAVERPARTTLNWFMVAKRPRMQRIRFILWYVLEPIRSLMHAVRDQHAEQN